MRKELRMNEKTDKKPVPVIQESQKGDLVAAAKRNADVQALSRQHRGNSM